MAAAGDEREVLVQCVLCVSALRSYMVLWKPWLHKAL